MKENLKQTIVDFNQNKLKQKNIISELKIQIKMKRKQCAFIFQKLSLERNFTKVSAKVQQIR